MRENGVSLVPLGFGPFLTGALRETELGRALALGMSDRSPAYAVPRRMPATIRPYATGSEALRRLEETGEPALVVVDDEGRVLGVLSAVDLVGSPAPRLRPRLIGGMATPFGVYLTTGTFGAGVGPLALVVTGMLLFGLFMVAALVSYPVGQWALASGWPREYASLALQASTLVLFMAGLRALPLAGIHAAEHMVVHAIERGEELVPEIVSRMPRVHPRCGTNIAAGAALFFGIATSNWIPDPTLRILIAAVATLVLWRPLGTALQYFVTTKPPTPAQIEMGIRAGRELLERYRTSHHLLPSIGQRLWNSGLLQLMMGSFFVSLVVEVFLTLLGLRHLLPVY